MEKEDEVVRDPQTIDMFTGKTDEDVVLKDGYEHIPVPRGISLICSGANEKCKDMGADGCPHMVPHVPEVMGDGKLFPRWTGCERKAPCTQSDDKEVHCIVAS